MEETKKQIEYEEYQQLVEDNERLRQIVVSYRKELDRLSDVRAIQRIEFLFEILKNAAFFDEEVIDKVTKELTDSFGFNDKNNDTEEAPATEE